jgi:hypothetical protein
MILLFCLIAIGVAKAQDIKFKKGNVFVDDTLAFTYTADLVGTSIYDLEGNDFLFLKHIRDNPNVRPDYYLKICFWEHELCLTTTYIFTRAGLLKRLMEDGVLSGSQWNEKKLRIFVLKHDENIERQNAYNVDIKIEQR